MPCKCISIDFSEFISSNCRSKTWIPFDFACLPYNTCNENVASLKNCLQLFQSFADSILCRFRWKQIVNWIRVVHFVVCSNLKRSQNNNQSSQRICKTVCIVSANSFCASAFYLGQSFQTTYKLCIDKRCAARRKEKHAKRPKIMTRINNSNCNSFVVLASSEMRVLWVRYNTTRSALFQNFKHKKILFFCFFFHLHIFRHSMHIPSSSNIPFSSYYVQIGSAGRSNWHSEKKTNCRTGWQ